MVNIHLSAARASFFFLFLLFPLVLSGCDALTGYMVKEMTVEVAQPVYMRCSDTAGLSLVDYCQMPDSTMIKFLFVNKQYVSIEGILVTLVSEEGNFEKEYSIRLNPSIQQLIEMEFPEQFAEYSYIKLRPSSYDPNGVISPCRAEMVEREMVRTCRYAEE